MNKDLAIDLDDSSGGFFRAISEISKKDFYEVLDIFFKQNQIHVIS